MNERDKLILCTYTNAETPIVVDRAHPLQAAVYKVIRNFFSTEVFCSKYLFELNTEELRSKLKDDFQQYLVDSCVKNPKVVSVSSTADGMGLSIKIMGCESIYTVEEMLNLIKIRVQKRPTGSSSQECDGYLPWEMIDGFNTEALLGDLRRLELLLKNYKEEE